MAGGWLRCRACRRETSITAGTIFEGTRKPLRTWFLAMWFVTSQKNGVSALGLQRALGLGSYETAWTWLHKLRRAMVRPGRDRLAGEIEADETYVGGPEEGKRGREVESKAIVAVAAEQRGRGIGRIRLRRVKDVSAESLLPFLQDAVVPGATIHTDGWRGYAGLPAAGYRHQVTVISGGSEPAHEVMPRVHKVAALLQTVVVGVLRAASSTNISTTTSTNSPSASIGVDHRPEASCSTASSSRRWPSDRPPTTPSSHPGYPPISPNWGNERDTHFAEFPTTLEQEFHAERTWARIAAISAISASHVARPPAPPRSRRRNSYRHWLLRPRGRSRRRRARPRVPTGRPGCR